MIKVVHISTSKHGGAGLAAYRIHDALNKSGKVESFFIQREKGECDSEKKIFYAPIYKPYSSNIFYRIYRKIKPYESPENNPIRNYVKNFSSNFEIVTYPDSSYRIENHPIVKEADIIHLHWVGEFLNYRTFFEKINKPIVWTLHDMNPFQGIFHYKNDEITNKKDLGKIDSKFFKKKIKAISKNNNLNIITLATWMFNLSKNSKALNKFNHIIIPNLIDFDEYPLLDKQVEKSKLHLQENLKTLMFIAQDIKNPRKGFDILIEALNLIDVRLNIITVGGCKIELKSNFNHLHFNEIKSTAKLNSLYTVSDIVALTSREDNLPNVMLESFANGTPVISFAIGGMRDWIKDGETGILVTPFSSDELAKKITSFIEADYNKFDRQLIYNYAKENFSIENNLDKFITLYEDLTN